MSDRDMVYPQSDPPPYVQVRVAAVHEAVSFLTLRKPRPEDPPPRLRNVLEVARHIETFMWDGTVPEVEG